MPNGGLDNCGMCVWNRKRRERAPGQCRLRGVKVSAPFWTYCANFTYEEGASAELPTIRGPVYASGIFEGYYTRIPWFEKSEPRTYVAGVCSVTGVRFDQGISVRDGQTGEIFYFATNDIYCDWVRKRQGAGASPSASLKRESTGDKDLHGLYAGLFAQGKLCCDFMHLGADKVLDPPLGTVLYESEQRWLKDKIRGAILCGAIGDAMGRQVEGRSPGTYPPATWYVPWPGWTSGPIGTITDDTQLTWWLAESLCAHGRLDPEDLTRRFTSRRIRGIGQATRQSVSNYKDKGLPWYESGVASSGNGAAMRAAPIGIFFRDDFDELKLAAGMQALVTHNDPMAVASSIVVAHAVAMLLRMNAHQLSDIGQQTLFCRELAEAISGIEDGQGYVTRRDGLPATLAGRIRDDIPRFLGEKAQPSAVQEVFWSGAYVLESLPFALYCFLYSPGNFDRVIFNAVNESRDSDTVAAMAGAFCGALNGLDSNMNRQYWRKSMSGSEAELKPITGMMDDSDYLEELEFRGELTALADRMLTEFWRT